MRQCHSFSPSLADMAQKLLKMLPELMVTNLEGCPRQQGGPTTGKLNQQANKNGGGCRSKF
jgi:hypothetical protein